MKSKFSDLILERAIKEHQARAARALEADRIIEDAVLPLYQEARKSGIPEQSGSCVVVKIETQYFLLSASHALEDFGDHRILVGLGENRRLAELEGTRFSTRKLSKNHQDDPFDASAVHLIGEIPSKLREVALTEGDFDFSLNRDFLCGAAGFKCKQTQIRGRTSISECELLLSLEYGKNEYSALNLDPRIHLALAYENKIFNDGIWNTSPVPKGMSGGAMIKYYGVEIGPEFNAEFPVRQLLAGIITGHRKGSKVAPGVLIGTRLSVHMSLICQFLPELFPHSKA